MEYTCCHDYTPLLSTALIQVSTTVGADCCWGLNTADRSTPNMAAGGEWYHITIAVTGNASINVHIHQTAGEEREELRRREVGR